MTKEIGVDPIMAEVQREESERFKGQAAEFETTIDGEITIDQARNLFDKVTYSVGVVFEAGSSEGKEVAYNLFKKLMKKMQQLGSGDGADAGEFWQLFTKLKTYDNFVIFGREQSNSK